MAGETEYNKVLMHALGCKGRAIFIRESALCVGRLLESADVQELDGTPAVPHGMIQCGTCGAILTGYDLKIAYIKDRHKRGWGMRKTIGFIAAVLALMAALTLLIVRPDDRKPCPVTRLIAPWLVCDHARL